MSARFIPLAFLALALRVFACVGSGERRPRGRDILIRCRRPGLAMGSAHTAVVNDVSSVYYNPAGLGLLPTREITLMRAFLYGDATYDYLAYAQNNRKNPGGWGAEFIQFKVGGASGRDQNNTETGTFGYSERAFGLAAAWRGLLHPLLSLGAKGRCCSAASAAPATPPRTGSWGSTFGAQMGPWVGERLMLGLMAQNVMSLKQGETEDSLKLLMRLGASYKVIGPLFRRGGCLQQRGVPPGHGILHRAPGAPVGLAQQGMTFGGGLLFKNAIPWIWRCSTTRPSHVPEDLHRL